MTLVDSEQAASAGGLAMGATILRLVHFSHICVSFMENGYGLGKQLVNFSKKQYETGDNEIRDSAITLWREMS